MNRTNKIVGAVVKAALAASVIFSAAPSQAAKVSADVDFKESVVIHSTLEAIRGDFEARTPLNEVYPNLQSVKEVLPDQYIYTLKPIGKAGVAHVTQYAASYEYLSGPDHLTMNWDPVSSLGNAELQGKLKFRQLSADKVEITLSIKGELREIDVPFLYVPAAPSVTRSLFEENASQYVKNLAEKYELTVEASK